MKNHHILQLSMIVLSFFLFSVSFSNVFSASMQSTASIDYTSIDAYIQGQMGKHGLKGVSLAITENDQIVYLQGYGTAGNNQPMTAQTPMYIGSQSKSFAGLAIAQLIQAGKIEPNAPVINYIPEFQNRRPRSLSKDHYLSSSASYQWIIRSRFHRSAPGRSNHPGLAGCPAESRINCTHWLNFSIFQ